MSLLKNQAAADAISAMLANPLQHPGNPDTKQQAAGLVVPYFRTAHQPQPYRDAIAAQNQTIAEAIIYFLENHLDHTIIPTPELEELRARIEALETEADGAYDMGYAAARNDFQPPSANPEEITENAALPNDNRRPHRT